MTWYSYPNSTDTQGVYEFFRFINNTTTEGLFFPVILLVTWVIIFIASFNIGGKNKPAFATSFTFASFICSILGIILTISGFLASKFMYFPFIMLALGVGMIMWFRD